jgi:CheY-like chemotaxis protein
MTSSFQILCIEDNPVNMLVVQRILESQSFVEILQATSAEEGIQLARKHVPNMILMDLALPGMDGLMATRIIKEDAELQHIPIIAVTASSLYSKEDCLNAGCADFVTKPVTMSRLLIALHRFGMQTGVAK